MATEYSDHVESKDKQPRTARGLKTKRKLLDAAALEFGEKGFHEASITGITQRAGTALGSFYTYFDSKDELFTALVKDMSARVKSHASTAMTEWRDAFEREKLALNAFMSFAREHKEIYRIIDEAEFVDPASYRTHYQETAARIFERLQEGSASGDFRNGLDEGHAWAIMGMNVFLGLRYGIWSEDKSVDEVAAIANEILAEGIAARKT
ncbi:MAG: TetR/AcrR family transcriptional regulator [Parasphingorhabdus sp.]|uniref:TetR/AcrR family transcriptional regulator n=1 Tax=Parasphingorhabdus sp. TaxID=2709688 RepID=UPI00300118BD